MKTSTVIATVAMSLLNVAEACYGSGDNWPSTEEARSFVDFACRGNGGMFTGNFAALQTKSMCPRAGSNNLGLLFEVQNLNPRSGFDLGNDDCYEKLTSQIFNCGKGGETTVAGWRFKADPGNC